MISVSTNKLKNSQVLLFTINLARAKNIGFPQTNNCDVLTSCQDRETQISVSNDYWTHVVPNMGLALHLLSRRENCRRNGEEGRSVAQWKERQLIIIRFKLWSTWAINFKLAELVAREWFEIKSTITLQLNCKTQNPIINLSYQSQNSRLENLCDLLCVIKSMVCSIGLRNISV